MKDYSAKEREGQDRLKQATGARKRLEEKKRERSDSGNAARLIELMVIAILEGKA